MCVATAPTVYGIETRVIRNCTPATLLVATAPTVYGIETLEYRNQLLYYDWSVATAPTVYGIETV